MASEGIDINKELLAKIAAGDEKAFRVLYDAYFNRVSAYAKRNRNFAVTDWMAVSLESLGKVTKIIFYMDSSDKTGTVTNTPAYFCLDGFRFKENIR